MIQYVNSEKTYINTYVNTYTTHMNVQYVAIINGFGNRRSVLTLTFSVYVLLIMF